MPLLATVSLVQYVAAGAPVRSHAALLHEFALEHYWIYTSFGVLLQLVSIELEIVYPWLLALQWHGVQLLRILDKLLVPLR